MKPLTTALVMAGIAVAFFLVGWLVTLLYAAVSRLLERFWPGERPHDNP